MSVIPVRQSAADWSAVAPSAKADPHRPALVLSVVGLGYALQINNGFYTPLALRLVVGGLVLAWAALLAPRLLNRLVPDRDGLVVPLAGLGLAVQLALLLVSPFAMYAAQPLPREHAGFVPLLMAAAVTAMIAVAADRRWRMLALAGLAAAHLGLGAITFKASPDPTIDVVTVHRVAFDALERGESPYSVTFPDIYKGQHNFYPQGAVEDGVVQFGYPYPIVALLMAWPGQLVAGDFRYAELAALALGGIAIAWAGQLSSVAVLAVALLLFTPRVFFELEQSWTEPLLVLWLGIALWAWRARWMRTAMTAIALLVAVKQYLVVAIPLAILMPMPRALASPAASKHGPPEGGPHATQRDGASAVRSARTLVLAVNALSARLRAPIVIGLIAVVTFIPVLLWDFDGFVRSALLVQVNETLRTDALSLAVVYARWAHREMSTSMYVAIVASALGLAAWRAPRTPGGYAAALAVVLFTTFAFGKKAFCNYYFFVIATLCAAIACSTTSHQGHEGHQENRE